MIFKFTACMILILNFTYLWHGNLASYKVLLFGSIFLDINRNMDKIFGQSI